MTHDPIHAIYMGTGAIYFTIALYFAFRNYQITRHETFWFFTVMFTLSMIGTLLMGTLWSGGAVSEETAHAYYDTFFLMSSIFLFVSAYVLHKRVNQTRIF